MLHTNENKTINISENVTTKIFKDDQNPDSDSESEICYGKGESPI